MEAAQAPAKADKPRVLIVDDSQTLLASVDFVLTQAGMEVVTTDNPITVGTLIRRHHPDVVLVDVEMPGIDGPTVVEIIGKHEGMRVLLYSSKEPDELRHLAQRSRADGYLVKHGRWEQLIRRIRNEVQRTRQS